MSHHSVYEDAIADFVRTEHCYLTDAILSNVRCVDIAWNFDKTPEQVAADIIRHIKKELQAGKGR